MASIPTFLFPCRVMGWGSLFLKLLFLLLGNSQRLPVLSKVILKGVLPGITLTCAQHSCQSNCRTCLPSFPSYQHFCTFSPQNFFHPKQSIVGHVNFLQVLCVECAFDGCSIPLGDAKGGHWSSRHSVYHKHLFCPTG